MLGHKMERQEGLKLSDIRADHAARYRYASKIASGHVLDAACGTGYGSYIMAIEKPDLSITAIDNDDESLKTARKIWKHENIVYKKLDLENKFLNSGFDWLVCFETIEHIKNPELFLKKAAQTCSNIICSVPNENVWPYNPEKHIYHHRHYTKTQFIELIENCGFDVIDIMFQSSAYCSAFNNTNGRTIIITAKSKYI